MMKRRRCADNGQKIQGHKNHSRSATGQEETKCLSLIAQKAKWRKSGTKADNVGDHAK